MCGSGASPTTFDNLYKSTPRKLFQVLLPFSSRLLQIKPAIQTSKVLFVVIYTRRIVLFHELGSAGECSTKVLTAKAYGASSAWPLS